MDTHILLPHTSPRDANLEYLRGFIVLLVLLLHSVLAYAVLWPAQSRTFEIFPAPIVDSQRWEGFDVLTTFNDTIFMALMYLLSGLFVWPSLKRRGGAGYLRERALRLRLLADSAFVLSCASISFAFVALFRRCVIARRPVFDNFSASSYGMYLVHYPIVVWLQFALLTAALSAVAKAAIVFFGAVGFSWGIVAAVRRIPMIARLL